MQILIQIKLVESNILRLYQKIDNSLFFVDLEAVLYGIIADKLLNPS